jgi:LAO/AO transport system kinase
MAQEKNPNPQKPREQAQEQEQGQYPKPEWAPADAGSEFAGSVVPGVSGMRATPRKRSRRKRLSIEDYVRGVREANRSILARAVTLVESSAPDHFQQSQQVLQKLLPYTGNSVRIGITGVPGVGKSTFIEAFGCYLIEQGHRVAVLAIDPSSSITGGSILGDKVRMEELGRRDEAFIRPSPSGGSLGGVARKSRETLLLCEAAGFDVILVETVGVGQSEVTVRSMTDYFCLLMLPGAGDEIQGIKKGIMELADGLFVNKADADNTQRARMAKAELNRVLHFLQSPTRGWKPHAAAISARTGDGLEKVWKNIQEFQELTRENGAWEERRQTQNIEWLHGMIAEAIKERFYSHPAIKPALGETEEKVREGNLSPALALKQLLDRLG